jgi:APA family basic amino acid/polyamine antiporter
MGSSRLAWSMSELGLIGKGLSTVSTRFHTPVRSILLFSGVAAAEALVGFLTGKRALETLANMYAFGAMLAYFISSMALIALRIKEPHIPRPYQVPLNVRWGKAKLPLLGFAAVLGTAGMVFIVVWTHELARILGPLWMLGWVGYYIWYRRSVGKPVYGSVPRDWDSAQLAILEDTGEWELYEQFKIEVERRKRGATAASEQPGPDAEEQRP